MISMIEFPDFSTAIPRAMCVILDDMHVWIVSENTWDMSFLIKSLKLCILRLRPLK